MLPFLLGGVVLGLGKLIYDAVTDDDKTSSSSSSSSGPSDAEIKRAREEERAARLAHTSEELLAETAAEVRALLKAHKTVVTGSAKPWSADALAAVMPRPAGGWPFPADSAHSQQTSDDSTSPALTLDDLRKSANLEGKVQGLDALKHLVTNLRYTQTHLKKEEAVAQLVAERNALKALAESL